MRNIIKGSIVLFLVLLTGACSKENLDPVPKTSLSDLSVFETKDRIVAQVNGLYSFMKSGQFLGGRYLVYNDIRDDNFIPNSNNGVTNFATWNHSVVSSTNEVNNCWGAIYAAINAINVFMEGLDANWTAGKLNGKITEAEKNQYKSEALALRGMSYFYLLQLYALPYNKNNGSDPGVPLRLKANKSAEGNDLARSSVAEVYTQILKDLNDAEPLAIATYGTGASNALLNTTRIHKNTIVAFKSRVYMHKNDWANVLTETAKMVPASSPFVSPSGVPNALNATFSGIWATPYTTAESIFSMPFTPTNLAGTQNSLAVYYHPSSGESYFLVTAAGSLFTKINAADSRKLLFVTSSGKTYIGKFTNYTTPTDYAPLLRYAEVLLNRAEAIVKSGNSVTQPAVDLLNAVRVRSYPAGAYTLASFATVQSFIDAVMLERNIEFLGEGIRNFDLMRTVSTIPGKDGTAYAMGNVSSVAPTDPTYVWPMPSNEANQNKLLK
jgi:starch-binding outer membrane protein, SusD/RagB family